MTLRELLEAHGLTGKPLLTFREVAHLLGVGRPAVERLVREGRLGAVRVSRHLYVPVSSLERLLNPVLDAGEVARVVLALLEKGGWAPRVRVGEDGFFQAEAKGMAASGLTAEEALWALARRLALGGGDADDGNGDGAAPRR
ncbi:helix-turn-helix domain-containing protein [Thermus sp.]|uniref:helix-turn-helix domain-containing protein n=1 Tax=Thermus sp. TaxID=275 RepID=UPI0026204F70|nr:helix-turn-helix domain-containing protein [Thermus sp.]MCX7851066.1 helix-turn-helix domain-containing protein [Thermus sp.]